MRSLLLHIFFFQLFSGHTSKGTRCVNMQLFIFICLAYLHLSDTSCIPVENLNEGILDHLK